MGRLISIDPGKDYFAFARFEDCKLVFCGRGPLTMLDGCLTFGKHAVGGTQVLVELPQVYAQRHWKGDPNDLIQVATTVGRIMQLCPSAEQVLPRRWKGTVPKKVMLERIVSKLTLAERVMVAACPGPKSKHHDILDAIGLGLWACKRL